MGRRVSVLRTTRGSGTAVYGILRHHPETALSAILALAYPVTHTRSANLTHLVVGPVHGDALGVAKVAIDWEIAEGKSQSVRFSGELLVTTHEGGAQLQLIGTLHGAESDDHDEAALDRVLGWLAVSVETSPISRKLK